MMKEITVFMPVYNAENYLKTAIESVLSQSFGDFEFLIVDDGSTDGSRSIIDSFSDVRIKLICRSHDYIKTLNEGLRSAIGKYIVRMDADDIMLPARLEAQYSFMESHSEVDICGSYIRLFGDWNEEITWYPKVHNDITNLLLLKCPLANSSTCIRKSFLDENEIRYSGEYIYCEDYKFWVDAFKAGGIFANIPQILLLYRCHSDQVSSVHHTTQFDKSVLLKQEIVEWYIDHIDRQTVLGQSIVDTTLPVLQELVLYNICSPDTFSKIIFDIISNLRSRGIIKV